MSTDLKLVASNDELDGDVGHLDDLETGARHWITKTPYVKYFIQTFLFDNMIVTDYPIMMYMSYPGFVTVEPAVHYKETPSDEEMFNQGLAYFNSEFDLIQSKGIKKQSDRLLCEKKITRIGKEQRRVLKTWSAILNPLAEDFYQAQRKGFSVSLKNADHIVNVNNKSEVFFPLCFKEGDNIVGGLFANAWETNPDVKNIPKNQLFDYFITGGCLFGNEVYGLDDQGRRHPMTNPRYEVKDIGIIQSIEYTSDRHADEQLTLQSLINILPLLNVCSQHQKPRLIYHLPDCEYILNIFHHYIHNRITTKACLSYIDLICMKKREHLRNLLALAREHDIEITVNSPLDPLMHELKTEEDIIWGLLRLTKLPMTDIFENESVVFDRLLDYLCNHAGVYKPLWCQIRDNLNQDEKFSDEEKRLTTLSYLSYTANLAVKKLEDPTQTICSILPGHEKRVQLSYKHLFSETYGNIFCIDWIPPILIKSEEHYNGVFFISEKLNKRVKSIIDLEISEHIFKSIGGIVMDDREFVMSQMDAIFVTLCAVHPRKQIYKILRSLVS